MKHMLDSQKPIMRILWLSLFQTWWNESFAPSRWQFPSYQWFLHHVDLFYLNTLISTSRQLSPLCLYSGTYNLLTIASIPTYLFTNSLAQLFMYEINICWTPTKFQARARGGRGHRGRRVWRISFLHLR